MIEHIPNATVRLLTICAALLLSARAVHAEPALDRCEAAAAHAGTQVGVPRDVLRAVMLTETGRGKDDKLAAWPWTVNMEGTGRWFDTRDEALHWIRQHHAQGARSYDIGCFQINHRWHGEAFTSLENMIDPDANALYAARFLKRLHRESGSWSVAAGAYHSRTQVHATRYRARFDSIRARLAAPPEIETAHAGDSPPVENRSRPQINVFPLLRLTDAQPASNGSLFPNQDG